MAIDFQKELNAEQLQVVQEGDGPCLVLAGAGSGKTRAVTYRVAYLLEKGVRPENILLLTFTNKAAREMLSRAEKICGQKPVGLWGGTFHAVANRLLRIYGRKLGFQQNFTVLDEDDAETLIKSSVRQLNFDVRSRYFPSARAIQSLHSFSRNARLSLEEAADWRYPRLTPLVSDIAEIVKRYQERKKQANAADFDDLLENLFFLLKEAELKNKLADQFRYVLVDEYQDTNKLQAEIVKLLASRHQNLLVVGDDAQSIYSFRAADINNILGFKKDFPAAQIFKLETNYRSAPEILDLANEVISQNKNQFIKNLISPFQFHSKPKLVAVDSVFDEAEFIAKKIGELKENGQRLSDAAVLFRAAFHAQALEMALARRGLPYEFRGGLRFFERAHVKDVLAFLRIFNNLRDEVAWWRVLEIFQGIGPETAKLIVDECKKIESIEDLVEQNFSFLNAKARQGWQDFQDLFVGLLKEKSPEKLIAGILNSAYGEYLASEFENAEDRAEDIKQLARYAGRAADLTSFLAEVSLDENYGRQNENKQDKIILSTIHQAKGLEWEAVFLIHLMEGAFPNERALKEGAEEEERRLFYVAITRAKKHLYLICPSADADLTACQPSSFLFEIKENLLEKERAEAENFSI